MRDNSNPPSDLPPNSIGIDILKPSVCSCDEYFRYFLTFQGMLFQYLYPASLY